MKTTLTIEQSATLISKGVSAERASALDDICAIIDGVPIFCPGTKPLFTLADLLSLLPKEITKDSTPYVYNLHIAWDNEQNKWTTMYIVYYDAMRCSVLYKTSDKKGVDLAKLDKTLDEALEKETADSLNKWINSRLTADELIKQSEQ